MNEVSKKLQNYQAGIKNEDEDDKIVYEDIQEPSLSKGFDGIYRTSDGKVGVSLNNLLIDDYISTQAAFGSPTIEDYSEQASKAGFGSSQYDIRFSPEADIETARAERQSWWSKVGAGLTKGGVTTLTTALNNTVGLVYGLGSTLFRLAKTIDNGEMPDKTVLNGFVNNDLSEFLIGIQRKSEEWFPNYRTAEERTEKYQKEWYKPSNLVSGNFIGDSLLKNFGFTAGSIISGVFWSRFLTRSALSGLSGNFFRGVSAASAGNSAANDGINRALQATVRGTVSAADGAAFTQGIINAGRQINRVRAKVGLQAAVLSAMGEGTVEGIMSKEEYMEGFVQKNNKLFYERSQSAEEEVRNSGNPMWVTEKVGVDANGNTVTVYALTEAGKAEVERRRQEINEEYNSSIAFADKEGEKLASTVFLLNIPLLTWSNTVQFGKLFNGGWTSAKAASRNVSRHVVSGNLLDAVYEGQKRAGGKAALAALKVMGSEVFEEMAQGFVSSGGKLIASKNLAAFANAGYSEDGMAEYADFMHNMIKGGTEFISDIKNWQEGFLGAITGLVSGSAVGAVRSTIREAKESNSAAGALNTMIRSEKFQNLFKGYIRHTHNDAKMWEALQQNDRYTWHTAADDDIINIISTFYEAGRIDDLSDFLSKYLNLTESSVDEIMELRDASDVFDHKSNAEVAESVQKRAKELNDKIEEYKALYDGFTSLAPAGSSKEFIQELTYTAAHLNDFDRRFLELFGDMMLYLDLPIELKSSVSANNTLETEAVKNQKVAKMTAEIESYLSYGRYNAEAFIDFNEDMSALISYLNEIRNSLPNSNSLSREDFNQKIEDLKKISTERAILFNKLKTLREPGGEARHAEAALDQDDIEAEAEEAAINNEVGEIKSIADIHTKYVALDEAGKMDFLSNLRLVRDVNPIIDEFLNIYDAYDELKTSILSDSAVQAAMGATGSDSHSLGTVLIDNILYKATSKDALEKGDPEDLIEAYPEYVNKVIGNIYGNTAVLDANTYDNMRSRILDAIVAFRLKSKKSKSTSSSKKGSTKSTKSTTSTKTSSTKKRGRGRKAAAAASGSSVATPTSTPTSTSTETEEERLKREAEEAEQKKKAEEEKKKKEENKKKNSKTGTRKSTTSVNPVGDDSHKSSKAEAKPKGRGSSKKTTTTTTTTTTTSSGSAKMEVLDSSSDGTTQSEKENSNTKARLANKQNTIDTEAEIQDKATDRNKANAYHYYRPSIPEVFPAERETAKRGNPADLSPFSGRTVPGKNDGYNEVYDFLDDAGAFSYIKSKLKVGDDIYFVIRQGVKNFGGTSEPTILMCVKVKEADGTERFQIVGILHQGKNVVNSYAGLKKLRKDIIDDYEKAGKPAEFVFGKTSKVWAKRRGVLKFSKATMKTKADLQIVDNNFLKNESMGEEIPLVFYGKSGSITILSKNKAVREKFGKILSTNPGLVSTITNGKNRLYMLVPLGDNASYVPVVVDPIHFNAYNNKVYKSKQSFQDINKILSDITNALKECQKIVSKNEGKTTEDELIAIVKEHEALLRRTDGKGALTELFKKLYGKDVVITLDYDKKYNSVRLSVSKNRTTVGSVHALYNGSEVSTDYLLTTITNMIENLDLALRFAVDTSPSGNNNALMDMLEDGLLYTNLIDTTPVGVDFYIWSYRNASTDLSKIDYDFGPYNRSELQKRAEDRINDNTKSKPGSKNTKTISTTPTLEVTPEATMSNSSLFSTPQEEMEDDSIDTETETSAEEEAPAEENPAATSVTETGSNNNSESKPTETKYKYGLKEGNGAFTAIENKAKEKGISVNELLDQIKTYLYINAGYTDEQIEDNIKYYQENDGLGIEAIIDCLT